MKIICFTIADKANMPYAKMMANSLAKFHPGLELIIYTEKDVGDSINYYKATPLFAKELIGKYDLVIKIDADSIITGNLNYIIEQEYDVGVVANYNRVDHEKYGVVKVWDINPNEYFNAGFVAMKSKRFVDHWWELCNSAHFQNLQYKEQDLLNILVHYGDYTIKSFDRPDTVYNYHSWHGLLSKGEWNKIVMKGDKLILPENDQYPEEDKEIKVIHFGGGKDAVKMNYKIFFKEDVIKRLDYLVGDKK